MSHEGFEKSKFACRQFHLATTMSGATRNDVEGDIACGEDACRGTATTKTSSDPGEEFAEGEGLDKVVVGAEIEKSDSLLYGVSCRENDHGDIWSTAPQTSQNLSTVESGKTEIENNETDVVATGRREPLLSIGGQRHGPAVRCESLVEKLTETGIIFDDCDQHRSMMTIERGLRAILRRFSAVSHVVFSLIRESCLHPTIRQEKTMKKSVKIILAGAVATVVLGIAAAIITESEGSERVEAIVVSRVAGDPIESVMEKVSGNEESLTTIRGVAPSVPAVSVLRPEAEVGVVPGLANLEGQLQLRGEDFMIAKRELDFGPDGWLASTTSPDDLDGDEKIEALWSELSGMVGQKVTVLGDVDDDDVDVFEIEGVGLRPLYSSVAPWSDEWRGSDVAGRPGEKLKAGLTADQASRIALVEVPGVVIGAQVDVNDGHPYWELDVRARDGSLYDIEIDAVSGKVVEIDRD